MELKKIDFPLTVCKLDAMDKVDAKSDFFFLAKTDEELSLVCKTEDTPSQTTAREDGWRAFRIEGTLDFSLIGASCPNFLRFSPRTRSGFLPSLPITRTTSWSRKRTSQRR